METDIGQIELRVLKQDSDRLYSYTSGHICIIFSRQGKFGFEYMGRSVENALPEYSNYLMCMHMGDFEIKFTGGSGNLIILDLPLGLLHQLILDEGLNISEEQRKFLENHMIHKLSSNSSRIEACLDHILEAEEKGQMSHLYLQSKKLELLTTYFETGSEKKQYECPFLNFQENVDKVRLAKQLLLEDLKESVPIPELARKVGMNENHLKSGFKEIYGKPIYQFYKTYKNEWAKRQLDERNISVSLLASDLGYVNVSHFIESFKKQFGITPKQYQLKIQSSRN